MFENKRAAMYCDIRRCNTEVRAVHTALIAACLQLYTMPVAPTFGYCFRIVPTTNNWLVAKGISEVSISYPTGTECIEVALFNADGNIVEQLPPFITSSIERFDTADELVDFLKAMERGAA
jgi:hypothetical protein